MAEKEFDEKTLKMAKFCMTECPVCTRGRNKGRGFLYNLVRLERHICPMCKAYEKVYGAPAHKKPGPGSSS